MPVDALVNELLALDSLDDTTVADLEAMQQAAAAGTLDPDDEAYIRALHARLTGQDSHVASDESPSPAGADLLDGLTIAQWRDRALAAEAEAQSLRDQLAAPGPA